MCSYSNAFSIVQVGPEDHAICALSGGVDSTVAATLVHKVLGDRLHCVFVDNGLLRYHVRSRWGGGRRRCVCWGGVFVGLLRYHVRGS